MEDKAGVPVEPRANLGVLVCCVVVEDDVDDLAGGNVGLDRIEKPYELLMAMALHAATDDIAFQDVERGTQGGGAMPLVVMRHCRATALLDRRAGLVRSSAWICDFSSTDNTTACAGGST